ncbi:PDZ domain-containing protein [Rhodopila globiformis]|nr:PDZ domain-containing protein [Rhodopila globiformis]
MTRHRLMALGFAVLLTAPAAPHAAFADNAMGYRLLSPREAAALPSRRGTIGLNVRRQERIVDSGLTFDIIQVTHIRRNSPGARAGFKVGDQIVAVDGQVFPSLAVFAAYIGSRPPGSRVVVDIMPAGRGPEQARRITVAVERAG